MCVSASPDIRTTNFSVVQVFSEYPGNSAQLRVLLVFYASTIVSALGAAEKITNPIVSMLLPYIQKVHEALFSFLCDEVYCVVPTCFLQKIFKRNILYDMYRVTLNVLRNMGPVKVHN